MCACVNVSPVTNDQSPEPKAVLLYTIKLLNAREKEGRGDRNVALKVHLECVI